MLASTKQIIRAAVDADPTLSRGDRTHLFAILRDGARKPETSTERIEKIIRRREAAVRYGCSLRLIDRLAQQGALKKVRLPGRQRAAGIRESDLLALITQKEVV